MNTSAQISALEHSGLIRLAQLQPELEYLFRHALVQTAAYDSILKADRKQLHLAVAREMESIYADKLDDLAALLANHYREAGETKKAYEYFKRAARRAFQKFANGEAEYNLRAALELCDDERQRAELTLQLGRILANLGRLDESEQNLRNALAHYHARGERETMARIYTALAQNYWTAGQQAEALSVALEGLGAVGDLPPSENYAELFRYASSGLVFTDRVAEAQEYVAQALAIAKACDAKGALAHALVNKALVEDRLGKSGQAIASLEEAIVHAKESGNLFALSRAHNNLAYVYGSLGKNAEAAEQYHRMAELSRETNNIPSEVWFLTQLNSLYIDLGKMDEARALILRADDLLQASGGKAHKRLVMQTKLQTLIYLGNCAETLADLRDTRAECLRHQEKQLIMSASFTLSLAHVLLRNYDQAARELQFGIENAGAWGGANFRYLLAGIQARGSADLSAALATLAQADQTIDGEPSFAETATRLYALIHIRAREKKFDAALQHAGELADLYEQQQYRWLRALVLWEAGEIALNANDKTKARELLLEAHAAFEQMNIPAYAAQIKEMINNL